MIATLSLLLKLSITAISFYWRNDTPSFVTCRSSSPNQFVPEIVSPWPSSSGLGRHTLLFVFFFKELISFIGSLDKCHTSFLHALLRPYFKLLVLIRLKTEVMENSLSNPYKAKETMERLNCETLYNFNNQNGNPYNKSM